MRSTLLTFALTIAVSGALGIRPLCMAQASVPPLAPAVPTSATQTSQGITPISRRADPLLDLPPLPKSRISLIGGTVARLDPIRDELVVHAFGGRDVKIQFDVRTQILQEEKPVSVRELRAGTRIYADTILKDGRVFAKTLRIAPGQGQGEATGQVTGYDPTNGSLHVRDFLSGAPFVVRLNSQTIIQTRGQASSASQLVPSSLVHISFGSGVQQRDARKIDILAMPGETFSFVGTITFVDFRRGYVVIAEQPGIATHEIAINNLPSEMKLRLKEGVDVMVKATFDGKNYEARSIDTAPTQQP